MKTTTKRLFQILYTITSFTTMSYTPIKNIKNRDTVTETDQNRKLPRHWHFHNMFCRKEEAHSMSIFSAKKCQKWISSQRISFNFSRSLHMGDSRAIPWYQLTHRHRADTETSNSRIVTDSEGWSSVYLLRYFGHLPLKNKQCSNII